MNGKKVLLIDEEKAILETYTFLLSREGYCVVTANSGVKAMKEFYQQPFDLIVMDLAIKNGNGHTLLEEVKKRFPIMPVIVLTEKVSEAITMFASLLGASALIEKPCSYEMLLSCIGRSLKGNRKFQ